MKVVALAGGVGAGKFLRGLARAVPASCITVVVNTGDDIRMHGLAVSPDLDSVTYWLAGVADRGRGWGRRDETFRAIRQLRAFDPDGAWFSLGDLDLATHLYRTDLLQAGATLSEATARVTAAFDLEPRILPMTDDPVTTRIDVATQDGERNLHFQEYWVRRHAQDDVRGVAYQGADLARALPAALDAIRRSDAVIVSPSNPVASIGPILAVPGYRDAIGDRREVVVGISPIVGGAPIAGMADRLMPAAGLEVSALGAAGAYADLLSGWVIDERDRDLASRIESDLELRVAVTDTIMADDDVAEALARTALSLAVEG